MDLGKEFEGKKGLLALVAGIVVIGLGAQYVSGQGDTASVASAAAPVTIHNEVQGNFRVVGDRLRLESNGPGIYFEELDQDAYREDYGHWRIIADGNALFFENWERGSAPHGSQSEYEVQDEFLSFHRTETNLADIANHVIQWQYDFLGSGVRPLRIGANWSNDTATQTPRTLSLVALDAGSNTLVDAVQIVPNQATPLVSIPKGELHVANAITTQGVNAGLHLYDRTTNNPSSWWYSPAPGVTNLYSDISAQNVITISDDGNTQQLCIGNTCLTEAQLQALLETI